MQLGKNLSPESLSALQNRVVEIASPDRKPVFSRDTIILAVRSFPGLGLRRGQDAELADHIIRALAKQDLHIFKSGHSAQEESRLSKQ